MLWCTAVSILLRLTAVTRCGRLSRRSHHEQVFVTIFASLVHALTLWLPCLLFAAAERFGFWNHHKLPRPKSTAGPPDDPQNKKLNQRAMLEQIVGSLVLVPLVVHFVAYPALVASGVGISTAPPDIIVVVGDVVVMIVACDAMFYWVHRTCHHPLLYKHIHKQHHEFKGTTIWASEYFGVSALFSHLFHSRSLCLPVYLAGSLLSQGEKERKRQKETER